MNNVSQLPIVFIIFLIMLLVISIRGTNLSNILYISAVASPSHFLWSQQFSSILARSGMVDVLFTHGGLLTIQEAMWHGIPMLGTPNYGDQYQNVHRIEKLGIGKKLYLEELNPVSLKGNLLGIIHNERYKQRATAIAKTIRDEQITPQRKALWTVEWVLRNYGTIQLLDDLNEVGYIEKNSLDVLSTLIIISICINFLLFRIIQVCVSFMTARVVRKNKMKKTP
ncbi:UDP-glucuronosyltransferase 2A1-like isoform X3 [Anopheles arabiensis]|uniref:UDP-glucuronosyltransferase 2A1-like isoform X3 n=1 Tax=Anopheles arabiensis TaxID=7173 RepID=UPI001AADDECB|nr:UDP-glucuronosyltransferase 2A1-like isoform X3 [Anopheles arabiensis]